MTANQRTLEVLLDKQEIHELHCKYCRSVDRRDIELMRSTFHDDAIIHHQPWYDGPVTPYIDMVEKSSKGHLAGSWSHMIANELTYVDGDRASSEWYLFQYDRIIRPEGELDFIVAGRFLERLTRRDGVWRVSERQLVRDVVRLDPVGQKWLPQWPDLAQGVAGQTSREDMSYRYMLDAPPEKTDS